MSRKIHCCRCNVYLGEIRDATLRKDVKHKCETCEDTDQRNLRLLSAQRQFGKGDSVGDVFGDVFGDLFGGKYGKRGPE